jgi:diaminopimelate decarboxylase
MTLPTTTSREIDSFLSTTDTGELLIEEVGAHALAEAYGTPLHVISETRLRDNYRRIRDAFAARWPAGSNIYFAIKSNPALAVRRALAQEGAGGDCLGLPELSASLLAGTPADRLVLNGNNKQDDAIEAAVRSGARVNVDDLEEVERIAAAARAADTTVRVGIRVKPSLASFGDRRSEMFDITVRSYGDSSKWGLDTDGTVEAVRQIKHHPELRLSGIHCHLGRHFAEPSMFSLVVPGLLALVAEVRNATQWAPSALTFGGGFTQGRDPFFRKPSAGERWPEVEDNFVEPIETYADALCTELEEGLARQDLPRPVLEVEPGRYITASAGLTLTRVGTVKRIRDHAWVMVDTCVAQLGMSRSPRDAHAVVLADDVGASKDLVCDVVGPLCVPDVIIDQGALPTVARGSLIAILDTGGYADGESSNANSIGRPAVVLVSGSGADLIRRRETFADVFGRDSIPARLMGGDQPNSWHTQPEAPRA